MVGFFATWTLAAALGNALVCFAAPQLLPLEPATRRLALWWGACNLGAAGCAIVAQRLLRRGHAPAARGLLVAAVYAALTVAAWADESFPSPALPGYLLAVAIGGALLGRRAAVVHAIACAAAIGLFAWLRAAAAQAAPTPDLTARWLLTQLPLLAAATVVVLRTSDRLRASSAAVADHRRSLAERNRELRTSEQRFEAVAHSSRDLIIETGKGQTILYASPNHHRLLGYASPELIGTPWRDHVHPDDAPVPIENPPSAAVLAGREPRRLRVRAADGSWRWFEVTFCRYESGGETRVLAILRDAQDRVRGERRARQRDALAHHAQKMRALERLAGGVSHELNNLLTVITLNAALLRAGAPTEGKPGPIGHILDAARRATIITRGLLALARPPAQEASTLDLNEQIGGLASILRPLAGDHVDLELRLAPEPMHAEVDPRAIGMLLANLVVSVREPLADGGRIVVETRRVEVAASERSCPGSLAPGSYVGVSVGGSGPLDPASAGSETLSPSKQERPELAPGAVQELVERAGGALRVSGDHGPGLGFEVLLPLADSQPSPQAPAPPAAFAPKGDETILLVEDQDAVRRALRRTLRGLGYHVIEAGSGESALEISRQSPRRIDLLLTDVTLSGIQGPELARRLRETHAGIRVLFVTGYASEAVKLETPLDYPVLEKPFTGSALANRVRHVLDQAPPS